jgi:hypothetical protein
MPPKKKKIIDKTEVISTFAENIEQLLDTEHRDGTYITCYSYVEIDGLPVDILIEKKNKGRYKDVYLLKMKIVNDVIFLDNNDNKEEELLLLKSNEINTIENVLEYIEKIKKDYKLVDHTIFSPTEIENLKIKRTFFPIPTDKNCSVCDEATVEYTVCKHPICFRCRYNCIATNKHTCPICNFGKLNRFPNELIYHDP